MGTRELSPSMQWPLAVLLMHAIGPEGSGDRMWVSQGESLAPLEEPQIGLSDSESGSWSLFVHNTPAGHIEQE